MATKTVDELRAKTEATWTKLSRQLEGLEPYLERSDAPGEWTAREVLSHLMFQPGWNAVEVLKKFSTSDYPVVEIVPGDNYLNAERRAMSLKQFRDALEGQKRAVFGYLDGLAEADLGRKLRIPLFKQIMGSDEVPIPAYVGALFDYHWNDHAGQLGKIRKAVGLPEA